MEEKKAMGGYSAPYRGRNDYYRDGSYILMLIVNFQAIIIGVLTFVLVVFLCTRHNSGNYFAETADGRTMPMVALEFPNPGMQARTDWAATAASDIMTFGFNDVNVRLAQSRQYFTPQGWESFNKALEASKLIDDVMKTQQIATAVPRAPAVMKDDGMVNGKRVWHVEVPLLITFRAGADVRPIPRRAILAIESQPTKENPFGWGISEWQMMN